MVLWRAAWAVEATSASVGPAPNLPAAARMESQQPASPGSGQEGQVVGGGREGKGGVTGGAGFPQIDHGPTAESGLNNLPRKC